MHNSLVFTLRTKLY